MSTFYYFVISILAAGCTNSPTQTTDKPHSDSITKIEMHLSAFGVESDSFPSIDIVIDFKADSNMCKKWFYNPRIKGSTYVLNKDEINKIKTLVNTIDFNNVKPKYKVLKTDQPSSKLVVYTSDNKMVIDDYGLEGNDHLKALYKMAYKY